MVDFGGWDMPVQYTTIIDEGHHARLRTGVGLFDISFHMGRLSFAGPDTLAPDPKNQHQRRGAP